MHFLQRLNNRIAIEARNKRLQNKLNKRGRSAVKDQLSEEEEDLPTENQQTDNQTSDEQQNQDEQQTSEEQSDESTDIHTGYGELEDDRFDSVIAYNPYLVIVSGANGNIDALVKFLKNNEIITNSQYSQRILGPETINPQDKNPERLTLGYLVSAKAIEGLRKHLGNIPTTIVNMISKIKTNNPFASLAISPELNKALGGSDVNLRKNLSKGLTQLKGSDNTELNFGEAESTLQMSYSVPLDYMRFLSVEHKLSEFYIGGHPSGAGRKGLLYVVCDKSHAELFIKTVKAFKPPKSFATDLYYPSSLDDGFTNSEPRKVKTSNCLILESNNKFDKDADLTGLTYFAETLSEGLDFSEFLEKRKAGTLPKGNGGQYVDGTHVKGNLNVHFSTDFKRAILWCSTSPINISSEDEKTMKESLGLSSIDKSFSK